MKKRFFFLRRKKQDFERPVNAMHWLIEKVQDLYHDIYYTCYYPFKERFLYGILNPRNKLKIDSLGMRFHDRDEIYLYACFQILEDHIVWDKAWMSVFCGLVEPSWLQKRTFYYKWNKKRNLEWGMLYLQAEAEELESGCEVDKKQAWEAKEKMFLYKWWSEIRPTRPDPHEEGMTVGRMMEYYEKLEGEFEIDLGELFEGWSIEAVAAREDQEMLERLTKIRTQLFD